jgi:hypothetical protein
MQCDLENYIKENKIKGKKFTEENVILFLI